MDTSMVVPSSGGNSEDGDKGGSELYIPLVELSKRCYEDYQEMGDLLDQHCSGFIRDVTAKDWTGGGVLLQDVIVYSGEGQLSLLLDYLQRELQTYPRRLFMWTVDGTHIHVHHDCSFASRQCKCHWRSNLPYRDQLKRGYGRKRAMDELRIIDWQYIVVYFLFSKGRRPHKVWYNGKTYESKDDFDTLRFGELRKGVRQILERHDIQARRPIQHGSGCVSDFTEDYGAEEFGEEGTRRKRSKTDGEGKRAKKGIWAIVQEKMESLIENTAITPLGAIKMDNRFKNDQILTNPKNQIYVNAALDLIARKFNTMSLREFEEMYDRAEDNTKLTFGISMNYFPDMEDSFNAIDDLLKYQFEDDDERIKTFLQTLVDVIDKQPIRASGRVVNKKMNGFAVISPKQAGKTFFFDMIFDLLMSKGKLTNLNRDCRFGFEDACSKRIVEWNEPNYSSDKTDYLKEFLEGKDTLVERKGIKAEYIMRTPCIITANPPGPPFLFNTIFAERVYRCTWKQAPFLKEHQYKPYPLTFFKILKKYEIEY